jgi:hypothetical protein
MIQVAEDAEDECVPARPRPKRSASSKRSSSKRASTSNGIVDEVNEFTDHSEHPSHTTAAALHAVFNNTAAAAAIAAAVAAASATVQRGEGLATAAAACWAVIAAQVAATGCSAPLALPAWAKVGFVHPAAGAAVKLCQVLCDKGVDNVMLSSSRVSGGNFTTALLLESVGDNLLALNANAFMCVQREKGGCLNITQHKQLRAVSATVNAIYLQLVLSAGCSISLGLQLIEHSTAELVAEAAAEYKSMQLTLATPLLALQQPVWRRAPHATLAQPHSDRCGTVAALAVKALQSAVLGRAVTHGEFLRVRSSMIHNQRQAAAAAWPDTTVGDALLPPAGYTTELSQEAVVTAVMDSAQLPEAVDAQQLCSSLTVEAAPATVTAAEQQARSLFSTLHNKHPGVPHLPPQGTLARGIAVIGSFAPSNEQPGFVRDSHPVFTAAARAPFVQLMSTAETPAAGIDFSSVKAVQDAHAGAFVFDAYSMNDELGGEQGGHLSPSTEMRSASMAVVEAVLSSRQFAAAAKVVTVGSEDVAEALQPLLNSLAEDSRVFEITACVAGLSGELAGREYSAYCKHGGVYLVLSPCKQHCYILHLGIHWSAPLLANSSYAWEGLTAAVLMARAHGTHWLAVCMTKVLQGWHAVAFNQSACGAPSLQGKGPLHHYRSMCGGWGGESQGIIYACLTLV